MYIPRQNAPIRRTLAAILPDDDGGSAGTRQRACRRFQNEALQASFPAVSSMPLCMPSGVRQRMVARVPSWSFPMVEIFPGRLAF